MSTTTIERPISIESPISLEGSITIERPITLVRGLLQFFKEAENCWSCTAIIYGSTTRFTTVEVTLVELTALLNHFHVKADLEVESFVCEFISDCPMDKLAEFGIQRLV